MTVHLGCRGAVVSKNRITAERLRELLEYIPETGTFIWRLRRGGTAYAGSVAGTHRPDGYIGILVDQSRYLAHQLAWLYVTGGWPDMELDHRDMVRSNNSIANLRLATPAQNKANTPVRSHSKSGIKGVQFNAKRGKWTAGISIAGKRQYLGTFLTSDAAHAAYCRAAAKQHGEFARAA